jgi:hypothetical protein
MIPRPWRRCNTRPAPCRSYFRSPPIRSVRLHRRLAVNSAVGSASRRGRNIRRREFIGALGGAAAWPLAERAQQPTVPVSGGSPEDSVHLLAAFREGLRETGFVESESDEMRNSP